MNTSELISFGLNPKFINPDILRSIGFTPTLPERFISKITKTETCWLWNAYRLPRGYGLIARGKSGDGMELAHRVSWILHFGPIDTDIEICHDCDNPPCVRPDHLFRGTQTDNMRDCVNKGRFRKNQSQGQDHPESKLTDRQVFEIVSLLKTGMTQQAIADRFNVSQSCIMLIKTGRSWSHLTGINLLDQLS